ncbi:MAG: radical SAM protein [Bacteroidales bacterium]|nr:radical SAM protein [Bacteroidales bacterium]
MEFDIQWHITNKCNLRCSHCYDSQCNLNELSHDECLKVIDEIAEFSEVLNTLYKTNIAINFTGGEPLLRDDLFELIEYANNKGYYSKILTNGTLLNDDIIFSLEKLKVKFIQISLDEIGEKHDLFRGQKGAFEKTISNIKKLTERNFKVNISCTISKYNIDKIDDLISLAIKLNVNGIKFGRLIPIGNGKNIEELLLSPIELKNIFSHLYNEKKRLSSQVDLILDDPLFNIFGCNNELENPDQKLGGCSIGLNRICITADGDILPCRRLPIKIGNIKEDTLRAVWFNSELLNNVRSTEKLKGKCKTCNNIKACFGCPAISYAVYQDYLEQDYQCWI